MAFIDKYSLISKLITNYSNIVEIGCGNSRRLPDAITIDISDFPSVDIVGDACEILKNFPDQCIDQFYAWHVLEHLDDAKPLLLEIERCLKPHGLAKFCVPHFSNPFFYSDPTHKTFFGIYTFDYLSANGFYKRSLPQYSKILQLQVISVHLGFQSIRPRYFRHLCKVPFRYLFNLSPVFQEFYEEFLCWILPCYEVTYVLKK